MPNQDTIIRIVAEFDYDSKELAQRCYSLIESQLEYELRPALEQAIGSKFLKEDIKIDKLEINIGTITETEFASEFASRVKRSFENALRDKLPLGH
jgi:hypothetical protein